LRASAAKSGTDPKAVLPSSNPQANTRQWRNPPAPTPLQCTIDKAAAAAQQAALEQKPSQPYLPKKKKNPKKSNLLQQTTQEKKPSQPYLTKKKKTPKISNLLQLTISSFFFFFFFVLSLARKKKKRKKKGRTVFTPLNSKNLVPTKKLPEKHRKLLSSFFYRIMSQKDASCSKPLRIVATTQRLKGATTRVL